MGPGSFGRDRLGVGERAETRVCVRCLLGPVGAGAERRNNPLTKHGNINQHQSLERRPLAPTSRYCLHLHPARKNLMLDRDIDGPVSRFAPLLPLSNAAIDPSGPCALHIIRSSRPPFPPHPLVHYIRIYIYVHMYLPLVFLVEEKIFSRGEIAVRRGEGIPFYTLVPKMVGARWMLVLRIRTRIGTRFRGEKKGKKSEKSRNNATRNDRST